MTKALFQDEKDARRPAVQQTIRAVEDFHREEGRGARMEEIAAALGITHKLASQRLGISSRAGEIVRGKDKNTPGSVVQYYPCGVPLPKAQQAFASTRSKSGEIDRGDLIQLKEEILREFQPIRAEVDELRGVIFSPATPGNFNIYKALRLALDNEVQALRRTLGDDSPAVRRLGFLLGRFPEEVER